MEEQAKKNPKPTMMTENSTILSTINTDLTMSREDLKGKLRRQEFLSKLPKPTSISSSNN